MYFDGVENLKKYCKDFGERQYITKGFLCARKDDGIVITKPNTNLLNIKDSDLDEITSETIEIVNLSYRAAAVMLDIVFRRKEAYAFSAIVDSKAILEYSKKVKSLKPKNDAFTQLCGMKCSCLKDNTPAELLSKVNYFTNVYLLKNSGAVVVAKTMEELFATTEVLDFACNLALKEEENNIEVKSKYMPSLLEMIAHRASIAARVNKVKEKEAAKKSGKPQAEKATGVETEEQIKVANEIKTVLSTMCEKRLALRTLDSVSRRLSDGSIMLTVNDTDNMNAEIYDFSVINPVEKVIKSKKKTTSYYRLHLAVLTADKEANIVMYVHPYYATLLGLEHDEVEIPDEYKATLGKKISVVSTGILNSGGMVKNMVYALGEGNTCIVRNRGVLIKAKSHEEGLGILQALEDMAQKRYNE